MSDIDVIKENVQFEQLITENSSNIVLKDEYLIPDTILMFKKYYALSHAQLL
ncbi:MAG: hypothetical protein ACLS2V_13620 [Clostridium paraputrificum]